MTLAPESTIHKCAVLLAALLLVGAAAAYAFTRPGPADAAPYHAYVRAVGEEIPREVGPWRSVRIEVPRSAVNLLKPNLMRSWTFYRAEPPRDTVAVLISQCRDTRDLAGHYPPKCYPNVGGWSQVNARPIDYDLDGVTLPMTEYEFTRQQGRTVERLFILNVLMLPNGEAVRNMGEVYEFASDYTQRHFGAAQLQLVFDVTNQPELTRERRMEVLEELKPVYGDVVKAILFGRSQVESSTDEP